MRKSLKRLISVLLTLILIQACSLPTFAANTDYSGHWAEKPIDKWMEKGIISGYGNSIFKPDNPISRAEFTAIVSRLFNYQDKGENPFLDIQAKDWYYDAVLKGYSAKILAGDGLSFHPEVKITRQEAFTIMAKAFDLKARNIKSADKFSDAGDIAPWSRSAIASLEEKGYISGRSGNLAAPLANLTRAETIELVDNIAGNLVNVSGTYSQNCEGNLLVNTPSVILKNMTVKGDLYLTHGIGNGDVTLDNVIVKGNTIVRGGGENSIIINDSNLQGILYVGKLDGRVRIVASGDSSIPQAQLTSGANLLENGLTGSGFGQVEIIANNPGQEVTLNGIFDSVGINALQAAVRVLEGSIGNLSMGQPASLRLDSGIIARLMVTQNASGASILLSPGASVTDFTANAATNVTGGGTIGTANINVNGVSLEHKPLTLRLANQVSSSIGGQTVGSGPTPGSSSGGSGGGHGGGSSSLTAVPITGADISISKGSIDFSYSFSTGSGPVTYSQAKAAPYYLDESASTVQLKTEGAGPSIVSDEIPLSHFMIGDNGAVRYNDFSAMAAAFGNFNNPPTHILLHLKGKTSVGGSAVNNPWIFDTGWIAFSKQENNIFMLYADKEALQIKDGHGQEISGAALHHISENLVLDTVSSNGKSSITWASSNPAVISKTGAVHQQNVETDVILTATLTLGTCMETKTFPVKVAAISLDDAALSNIEILGGGILRDASGQNDVSFTPDTVSYSVYLNGVSAGYIGIRSTVRSAAAHLLIDGTNAVSGNIYYKALSEGTNTVTFSVTSANASTYRDYTLTVERPAPGSPAGQAEINKADFLSRYNDTRDVRLVFSPPGSEKGIREYRVIASPEDPDTGMADFGYCEATPYYLSVQPAGASEYTVNFPVGAKDIDGNNILTGKYYSVIVLSIADGTTANVNTKSDSDSFKVMDYFNISFVEGAGSENQFRINQATLTLDPTTGAGSIELLEPDGNAKSSYQQLTSGALEFRVSPHPSTTPIGGSQITLSGKGDGLLTLSAAGIESGYYVLKIETINESAARYVPFQISDKGTRLVVMNLVLEGNGGSFIIKPKSSGSPGNEFPNLTFASGSLDLLDTSGIEKGLTQLGGSSIEYRLLDQPNTIEAGDQITVADNGNGLITVTVTDSGNNNSTNGDYLLAIKCGLYKFIWFTVTNGTVVMMDAVDKDVPK